MSSLTGCAEATGTVAPLSPTYVASIVALVLVWIFLVKATVAVAAVLAKLTRALAELAVVVASFLGAAAVTGIGLALVTWVTLS